MLDKPSPSAFSDNCPEQQTLEDLLLGRLPETEVKPTMNHVSHCQPCGDTVRGMNVSDTFHELAMIGFESKSHNANENPTSTDAGDENWVNELIQKNLNRSNVIASSDSTFSKSQSPDSSGNLQNRAAEVTRLLPAGQEDASIGQLGVYRIEQLIGAGSTGVVFRAVDESLDRIVALKILRPSLGNNARERFMAEARAAAAIDHENVITIYQVGIEASLAFIAMQWLPGQTLEQYILVSSDESEGITGLDMETVQMVGRQVAGGLAAAHAKGLVHRDIKPANIWLETDRKRIKILDFGLVRVMDDDPMLTDTGLIAGTPSYMSPEQTRGQELDARSDLFSLGSVLYQITTGQLPFSAHNILGTLHAIQHTRPAAPIEINPQVPNELSQLIVCLLENDRDNRPSSAVAVANAVDKPSSEWSFEIRQRNETQKVGPKTQSGGARNRVRNWLVAAALLPIMGVIAFLAGPQIIRIATDKGQLEIRTDDEDVIVEIKQNGRLIDIVDLKTRQKIEIRSGEYSIVPTSDKNSFTMSSNKVIMTRGGHQIVEITNLGEKSSDLTTKNDGKNLRTTAADLVEQTEPTFNGKTQRQLFAEIRAERNPAVLATLFEGVYLVTDKYDDPQNWIALVQPIIRKLGTSSNRYSMDRILNDRSQVNDFIQKILVKLPPETIVSFLLNEIENGTDQSRRFLFRILDSDHDEQWRDRFSPALQKENSKINRAIVDYRQSMNSNSEWAEEFVFQLYVLEPMLDETNTGIYSILESAFHHQHYIESALTIRNFLLSHGVRVDLASRLNKELLESSSRGNSVADLLNVAAKLEKQEINRIVPGLIETIRESSGLQPIDKEAGQLFQLLLQAQFSDEQADEFIELLEARYGHFERQWESMVRNSNTRNSRGSRFIQMSGGVQMKDLSNAVEQYKLLIENLRTRPGAKHNGKDREQWMGVLQTSSDAAVLSSAVESLQVLTPKKELEGLVELFMDTMRRYDNVFWDRDIPKSNEKSFRRAVEIFLDKFSTKVQLAVVQNEIKIGNNATRQFVADRIMFREMYDHFARTVFDNRKSPRYEIFRENADEIIQELFVIAESDRKELKADSNWAVASVAKFVLEYDIDATAHPGLIDLLTKSVADEFVMDNLDEAYLLSATIKYSSDPPESLFTAVDELLIRVSVDAANGGDSEKNDLAVDMVVRALQNVNSSMLKLVIKNVSRKITFDPKQGGAPESWTQPVGNFDRNSAIFNLLAKVPGEASEAIPYLKIVLRSGTPSQALTAKKLLEQINAAVQDDGADDKDKTEKNID